MNVPDLPPHDEFLERGVLGAILCQPDTEHSAAILADLGAFLEAKDFFRERHALIYSAIQMAYKVEGQSLFGNVLRRLRLTKKLDDAGGSEYLTGLVADASPALIVREEALYLGDLGLQRLLMEAQRRVAVQATGSPATAASALEDLNRRVQEKRTRLETARGVTRGKAAGPFAHLLELE